MAEAYPTTGLGGYGATEATLQAKVSAVAGSPLTTVEDISITNDAGPVRIENFTVTYEASGAVNATKPTEIAVPADAQAAVITPPGSNTIQLYANCATGTTAVGLKLALEKPQLYTFDAPLGSFFILAAKSGAGGTLLVKVTWL